MAVNSEFPQPDIAAELNNTGRDNDNFPQSSLEVYKCCPFLIRAVFRFPNASNNRRFVVVFDLC